MLDTPVRIAGHRGMGCTDSAHAIQLGNRQTRPLENTLASLSMALGPAIAAALVETDLIRTRDDRLVLTHSADFTQHVQPEFRPDERRFIDELSFEEATALRLGPDGAGRIPSLQQLLQAAARLRPGDDLVLNLEIKDVQGTPCRRRSPPFAALVLAEIRAAGFPLHRIRFSSFSLDALAELAELEPKARIGMLFNEALAPGEAPMRIFAEGEEAYRLFTPAEIETVLKRLPHLEAVHPEVQTLTGETVGLVAAQGLDVATWGWLEESPRRSRGFEAAAREAVRLCREAEVPLVMITDHVVDLRLIAEDELRRLGS